METTAFRGCWSWWLLSCVILVVCGGVSFRKFMEFEIVEKDEAEVTTISSSTRHREVLANTAAVDFIGSSVCLEKKEVC